MSPKHQKASRVGEYYRVSENLWRRKSSGVYYAFLKHRRKQFRRSLGTDDRELAKRKLKDLRAEIENQVNVEDASRGGMMTYNNIRK